MNEKGLEMQVELSNRNNVGGKIAKAGGIGAAVGATVIGGLNYASQKHILKNGDVYLKQMEGEVAKQMRFCTPFFRGTQEAADVAKEALQKSLDQFKQFVQNGKVDFKKVATRAGIGALIVGATVAGITGLVQLCKKQDK